MRNSGKIIFHIDVNSAYLAWEAIKRLEEGETTDIRDIPAIVGGDPVLRRGIVLSKSLSCKPFKIQTGESLYSALSKCPHLTVVPARFGLYENYSDALIEYLRRFSDRVQQYSIDEAFVDYTYMEDHFGPPMEAADKIRTGIQKEFGYTVCIGVSSNKLLAKMATELRKPNYTNSLFPHEIEKMWALPIEELFMAGFATAPKLRKFGISTIGDLAHYNIKYLIPHFKSFAHVLWQYANGIDDSDVITESAAAKSIGNSTTIPYDVKDCDEANVILLSLCESVGMRLRKSGYSATVISVGIRTGNFEYYSKRKKISFPTDNTTDIYNYAKAIFKEGWRNEPVRQLGVQTSGLCSGGSGQLRLLGQESADRNRKLDRSVDEIRSRFGDSSVMRASYLCRRTREEYSLKKFSPFRSTGGLGR